MMAQVEHWRHEDAREQPPPPSPSLSAVSPSGPAAAAADDDTCHHPPPTTTTPPPPMPKYLAPLAITTLGLGSCLGVYLLAVASLQHGWPIATHLPPSLLPYLEPTTLALVGVILRELYHWGVTLGLKWQAAAVGAVGAAADWADASLAGFGAALLEAQQRRQREQQQQALIEGDALNLLATARGQAGAAGAAVGRGLVWLGRFALHTHHGHGHYDENHPPQPPFPLPQWTEEPLRLAVRVILCFLAIHCLRLGRRPLGARRRQRRRLQQQQQQQGKQEKEKQAIQMFQQQHLLGAAPAFPLTPVSVTSSFAISTPTSSAWTPRRHRHALGERVLAIFTLAFGFSLGIGILAIDAAQRRGAPAPGMVMDDVEMCPPQQITTITSYPSLSSPGPTLRPPVPPPSEQPFPPDPSIAPTMAPRARLVEEGGRDKAESLFPMMGETVGEQEQPEGVEQEAAAPFDPEPEQQQAVEEEAEAAQPLMPPPTEPSETFEPEQQQEQQAQQAPPTEPEQEPQAQETQAAEPEPEPQQQQQHEQQEEEQSFPLPVIKTPPSPRAPEPEQEPEPEKEQQLEEEEEEEEEEEDEPLVMDLPTALRIHDPATIRATLLHSPYYPQTPTHQEAWSPLHVAAWEGRAPIVAALLELGKGPAFDPSNPGPGGVTPLMLASKAGNVGVVRALLDDPRALSTMDAEDDEGRTALIEAREQEHPAVLLTLAHAGAKGLNDLHWADGKALVHAVVEALRDDDDQEEAWAALLEWLVAQPHVDVNTRTGGLLAGMTPLQLAAVRRRRRATQILTQDARVRAQHFRMVSKGLVEVTLDATVKAWLWWNGWAMESPF